MLELIILLVVGFVLAAMFVWWAVQLWGRNYEVPPAQVGELLQLLSLSGVSYRHVEQLFDAGDYRYLERLRLSEVARQLNRDRRQAALLWLGLLREDFVKLQRFHRILLACGASANPRAEWTFLVNSLSFRLSYALLAVWIRVFGLYAAPRAHTALVRLAYEMSSQVACVLARLPPAQLAEVKQRWAFRESIA